MQDRFITEQFVSEELVNDALLLHKMYGNDALESEAVPMLDRFIIEQLLWKKLNFYLKYQIFCY